MKIFLRLVVFYKRNVWIIRSFQVAVKTGNTAESLLKAEFPSLPVEITNYKENPRDVVGNGSGIK